MYLDISKVQVLISFYYMYEDRFCYDYIKGFGKWALFLQMKNWIFLLTKTTKKKNNGKERALFSSEVPTSQTMFFFLRHLCVKTLIELIEFANYILNRFLKGLKEYSKWLK